MATGAASGETRVTELDRVINLWPKFGPNRRAAVLRSDCEESFMRINSRILTRSRLFHLERGFARLLDLRGSSPAMTSVMTLGKDCEDWDAIASDWMVVGNTFQAGYKKEKKKTLASSAG